MRLCLVVITATLLGGLAFAESLNIQHLDVVTSDPISDLVKRLDAKDKIIDGLVEKIAAFENKINDLTTTITIQTPIIEGVKDYKDEIIGLKETVTKQSRQIFVLEDTVRELKDASRESHDDDQDVLGDANEVEVVKPTQIRIDSNRESPSEIQRKRQTESEAVAFFATLTKVQEHMGQGQNIIFDRIVTNEANGYNPHHGIFIAPVSGFYVFSVSLVSVYGHDTHFKYVKNGVDVSYLYVGAAGSTYDTSSQTIVLHLAQGDDVAVQLKSADEGIDGYNYSTFCGFLQQQTFSTTIVGK